MVRPVRITALALLVTGCGEGSLGNGPEPNWNADACQTIDKDSMKAIIADSSDTVFAENGGAPVSSAGATTSTCIYHVSMTDTEVTVMTKQAPGIDLSVDADLYRDRDKAMAGGMDPMQVIPNVGKAAFWSFVPTTPAHLDVFFGPHHFAVISVSSRSGSQPVDRDKAKAWGIAIAKKLGG